MVLRWWKLALKTKANQKNSPIKDVKLAINQICFISIWYFKLFQLPALHHAWMAGLASSTCVSAHKNLQVLDVNTQPIDVHLRRLDSMALSAVLEQARACLVHWVALQAFSLIRHPHLLTLARLSAACLHRRRFRNVSMVDYTNTEHKLFKNYLSEWPGEGVQVVQRASGNPETSRKVLPSMTSPGFQSVDPFAPREKWIKKIISNL